MNKFLLAILLIIVTKSYAQFDIESIKKEITSLNSDSLRINYWENLHHYDQTYRGKSYNDINDHTNLIKVILMLEQYGYPIKKTYGYKANTAPWIIWTHNPSYKVKKQTIQIIELAAKLGELPNGFYPSYFYGGIYRSEFGFDSEMDSIDSSYVEIVKKQNSTLTIENTISLIQDHLHFRNLKVTKTHGKWTNQESDVISINEREDGILYFEINYEDGSFYPLQLKKNGNDFIFINTYEYLLRLDDNLNLILVRSNGEVIEKYKLKYTKLKKQNEIK